MLRQDAKLRPAGDQRIRIGSVHGGYILWGGGPRTEQRSLRCPRSAVPLTEEI